MYDEEGDEVKHCEAYLNDIISRLPFMGSVNDGQSVT